MKKKILFIDRDGTILQEPADYQIDSWEKMKFLDHVITSLHQIVRRADYELVMVTNQDGLGTTSFPEADFWPVHNFMIDHLAQHGITFREVLIDKSLPADQAPTRKPGTALVSHYTSEHYDLAQSYVIGDRPSDVAFAQAIGCQAIYLSQDPPAGAIHCEDWPSITAHILSNHRVAHVQRETSETSIDLRLQVDGSGHARINTGLNFLDHMLDQLATHGAMDIDLSVRGDLEVDEHHTVEDTAIALGQAMRDALGSKKGIKRYAFVLPMDEAAAKVSIDLGGRAELVWEAAFQREYVGDVPTEMWKHFFKSWTDHAACTLHIQSTADNDHHRIESIFKAWARCLRSAVQQDGSGAIPSSKGQI